MSLEAIIRRFLSRNVCPACLPKQEEANPAVSALSNFSKCFAKDSLALRNASKGRISSKKSGNLAKCSLRACVEACPCSL